jgi:hypothetical protein
MNIGSMIEGKTERNRAGVFAGSKDPLGLVTSCVLGRRATGREAAQT